MAKSNPFVFATIMLGALLTPAMLAVIAFSANSEHKKDTLRQRWQERER